MENARPKALKASAIDRCQFNVLSQPGFDRPASESIGNRDIRFRSDSSDCRVGSLGPELRPYQSEAIDLLRRSLATGTRRIILNSPTGSGKTEIAMAIVRGVVAKGKRVVFLVNRIELLRQASRRFQRAGIEHGIVQGDNTIRPHASVVIASIQTVARRGIADIDLIIIDEAHGVPGSCTYRELLFQRNAVPVIGLTATPFSRGMGKVYKKLGGPLFEELLVATTIAELIERGELVDVEVYAPSEPDTHGIKIVAGDYNEKELGKRVNTSALVGDIISHYLRLAKGTPAVCFATNIAHSKHIVERFLAVGVTAEHIDCYSSDEERRAILERVRDGRTMVVSNVGILAEGWDFPACRTLILARPTRSLTRFLQMIGRVLRPFPGKEKALVLDHSGSVSRLGFPTDDLLLKLDDGAPKKATQLQRAEPLPKTCPKCHYLRPAKVHICPACGFVPERQNDVVVADGELVKMRRRKPVRKDSGQHVYSQLLGYAEKHRYKPGWAYHKYGEFFGGKKPNGLRQVATTPTPELLSWIKSRQIARAKGKEVIHGHGH